MSVSHQSRSFGWFVLPLLLLGHRSGKAMNCMPNRCRISESSLRFNIIGDFGGRDYWPYATSTQHRVAKAVAEFAEEHKTHFQQGTGDNFYEVGVQNAQSPRFKDSFENVYLYDSLNTPWYMIAGNHDHHGNVTAQLEYSKISNRWKFPSLYYTTKYGLNDGTKIDFVMIDTQILCGNKMLKEKSPNAEPKKERQVKFSEIDVDSAERQWEWLEKQLEHSSSRARYLFVVGHYPIYSISHNGPNVCLIQRLLPMLHQYRVSAYISGHDHALEHLKTIENGWTLHHVVSGMGAESRTSKKHEKNVPPGVLQFHFPSKQTSMESLVGGFVYCELTKNSAFFHYYNDQRKQLYNFELQAKRI